MTYRRHKLYCFPYAGGSAAIFNGWRKILDKNLDLQAVELAGRGKRIFDPLYESIQDAVEDVFKMIKAELLAGPFGFFGHSMGCIIAFELAHKLRKIGGPQPSFVFFSGRGAPQVVRPDEKEKYYLLPDDEFRNRVLELGGTPKEFFEHEELMAVFLPMLKRDFQISETYESSRQVDPFNYPIHVMIGKDEDINAEQMHGWKDHSSQGCTIHYLAGGHFFINEQPESVVEIINNTVKPHRHEPKPVHF